MPRKRLTDAAIGRLKTDWLDRATKHYDAGCRGLYCHVSTGGKVWRYRYQLDGREYVMTIGRYQPNVKEHHMSLAAARARASTLRAEIEAGANPAADRKKAAQATLGDRVTFKQAADDYLQHAKAGMRGSTPNTARRMLEKTKPIQGRDIAELKPAELRDLIKGLEQGGKLESSRKLRYFLGRVFSHAVGLGWRERNPIPDLPRAVHTPKADRIGRPGLTDPQKVGALLRAIDGYDGQRTVVAALKILPHVMTRPGELRLARWKEIDFKQNLWIVPRDRMKARRAHVVPLSTQVASLFWQLHLYTDDGPNSLVFPSLTVNDRPISENTINGALRRLGYDTQTEHCAHGFRKTASTLLNEARQDAEVIEWQLAHVDKDRMRGIYNQATLLPERTALMQFWSDKLDALKVAAAEQNAGKEKARDPGQTESRA